MSCHCFINASIFVLLCSLIFINTSSGKCTGERCRGSSSFCKSITPQCFCRRKHVRREALTCLKNDCLSQMPTTEISDVEGLRFESVIIVRQKNLTEIKENDLAKLSRLKVLRLSGNKISKIHKNAFGNLTSMTRLDLRKNNLNSVPAALKNLHLLEKLNLGGNLISHIDLSILSSLNGLKYLILNRNKIINFPTILPRHIKKLSISSNLIETIPDIRQYHTLKTLYANSNKLKRFPQNKLPRSLRAISLCTNSIQGPFSVTDLTNLTFLDVSNNPLMQIVEQSSFYDKCNEVYGSIPLRYLIMKNCGLKIIGERAFLCLGKLKHLDVSENNLEHYNRNWFSGNRKLRTLYLSGNKWKCSCETQKHLASIKRHFTAKLQNTKHKKSQANFTDDFDQIFCKETSGATAEANELIPLSNYVADAPCTARFKAKRLNPCGHEKMKQWLLPHPSCTVEIPPLPTLEPTAPVVPSTASVPAKTTNQVVVKDVLKTMSTTLPESSTTVTTTIPVPTEAHVAETTTVPTQVESTATALPDTSDEDSYFDSEKPSLSTDSFVENLLNSVSDITIMETSTTTTAKTASTTTAKTASTATSTTTASTTTSTTTASTTTASTTTSTTTENTTAKQTTTSAKATFVEMTPPESSPLVVETEAPKRCFTNQARTCKFPYVYEGELHYECQYSYWSGHWCSLTDDYDTDGSYAECVDVC